MGERPKFKSDMEEEMYYARQCKRDPDTLIARINDLDRRIKLLEDLHGVEGEARKRGK